MMGLKEVGIAAGDLIRHGISFPGVEDMDYIFDLYRPIPTGWRARSSARRRNTTSGPSTGRPLCSQ